MNGDELALALLIVTVGVALGVWVRITSRRKQIVRANSAVLKYVTELNTDYGPRLHYFPPIRYAFVEAVGSKSRFDRFDLGIMFHERLAAIEGAVHSQIEERNHAASVYSAYSTLYERHGQQHSATSGSDQLKAEVFRRIEARLFGRMRLRQPQCTAQVSCTVTYTSPQGRNSYRRSREWTFTQLVDELSEMRRFREQRSTTEFLRRQERNRMTGRVRAEVLRRDGSRCQMCGTTPSHGAVMHVDHIVPVSHGGKTIASNLQALCQDCNLGKSNVL